MSGPRENLFSLDMMETSQYFYNVFGIKLFLLELFERQTAGLC